MNIDPILENVIASERAFRERGNLFAEVQIATPPKQSAAALQRKPPIFVLYTAKSGSLGSKTKSGEWICSFGN